MKDDKWKPTPLEIVGSLVVMGLGIASLVILTASFFSLQTISRWGFTGRVAPPALIFVAGGILALMLRRRLRQSARPEKIFFDESP
jgi:hypothetical protein